MPVAGDQAETRGIPSECCSAPRRMDAIDRLTCRTRQTAILRRGSGICSPATPHIAAPYNPRQRDLPGILPPGGADDSTAMMTSLARRDRAPSTDHLQALFVFPGCESRFPDKAERSSWNDRVTGRTTPATGFHDQRTPWGVSTSRPDLTLTDPRPGRNHRPPSLICPRLSTPAANHARAFCPKTFAPRRPCRSSPRPYEPCSPTRMQAFDWIFAFHLKDSSAQWEDVHPAMVPG